MALPRALRPTAEHTSLPDFSAAWTDFSAAWTAVSMLISCPAMTYAGGRDGWLVGGTRCISHACPVLSMVVADGQGPRLPYFAKEGRLGAMAKVPREGLSRASAALWELLIPSLVALVLA
jgi:hypothetical protein